MAAYSKQLIRDLQNHIKEVDEVLYAAKKYGDSVKEKECIDTIDILHNTQTEIQKIQAEQEKIFKYGDFEKADRLGKAAQKVLDDVCDVLDFNNLIDYKFKDNSGHIAKKVSRKCTTFTSYGRKIIAEGKEPRARSPLRNHRRANSGYHDIHKRGHSSKSRAKHVQADSDGGQNVDIQRKSPAENKIVDEQEKVVSAITCPFCLEYNEAFLDADKLTVHYAEVCPVLTKCSDCDELIPISKLNHHYMKNCPKKDNTSRKPCQKCTLIFTEEEMKSHTVEEGKGNQICPGMGPPEDCEWCPFCYKKVDVRNSHCWNKHFIGNKSCEKNPRRGLSGPIKVKNEQQEEESKNTAYSRPSTDLKKSGSRSCTSESGKMKNAAVTSGSNCARKKSTLSRPKTSGSTKNRDDEIPVLEIHSNGKTTSEPPASVDWPSSEPSSKKSGSRPRTSGSAKITPETTEQNSTENSETMTEGDVNHGDLVINDAS